MEKSTYLTMASIFLVLASLGFSSAATCNLDASLVYQDPYPAMPGEYVELVFQITGVENPECGLVEFELLEEYPFSLDPNASAVKEVYGGTYAGTDFKNYLIAAYKVRVDENAVDEESVIKAKLSSTSSPVLVKEFNTSVTNFGTDFEISIKDYDPSTNTLTFEILNIGERNVEALTVQIDQQENIQVKGGNRNIVGDLDSNEDTTFSFEAIPDDGDILLNVFYTDEINVRREIAKSVYYDSSYFTGRKSEEAAPKTTSFYVAIVLGAIIVLYLLRTWWKRRQRKNHHHLEMIHHKK